MTTETAVTKTSTSPLIQLGARFNIEPTKLVEVLRGTCIKPDRNGKQATNEEVAAFCIVANQYGLSPFTREIHAFTSGDKGVVPIVGIDGWAKIVNEREDFDGCEFVEVEKDGKPVSVTCKMYVKERKFPVTITERFEECKRNSIPWNTMPFRMLRHKAYMQAARLAFGLAGIYDEDEARDIAKNELNITPVVEAPKPLFQKKQEVVTVVESPVTETVVDMEEPVCKTTTEEVPVSAPQPEPDYVAKLLELWIELGGTQVSLNAALKKDKYIDKLGLLTNLRPEVAKHIVNHIRTFTDKHGLTKKEEEATND
jgi:phage recombination protein Bet